MIEDEHELNEKTKKEISERLKEAKTGKTIPHEHIIKNKKYK